MSTIGSVKETCRIHIHPNNAHQITQENAKIKSQNFNQPVKQHSSSAPSNQKPFKPG